jgi:hypothetical protein
MSPVSELETTETKKRDPLPMFALKGPPRKRPQSLNLSRTGEAGAYATSSRMS